MLSRSLTRAPWMAGVLVAAGWLGLQVPQTSPRSSQVPPPPPPPSSASQASLVPTALAPMLGGAEVLLDTRGKALTLRWTYREAGETKSLFQTVPLAYWPTAAEAVGDKLLVAGQSVEEGLTVVDRWSLSYRGFPKELPTVAVERLYGKKEDGYRNPRWMERMSIVPAEASHRVLCQFGDSKNVGVLDTATGAFTLALSTDDLPALATAEEHRLTWAGVHREHGAFYVMQRRPESSAAEPILLFDRDQDGDLDRWLQSAGQDEWDALMGEALVDWKVFD